MSAYLVVLAFVTGFGLPVAVIFASTAQGKATVAALEGITRQPESAPRAQLSLIIGLALIEALVIYSLLVFFLLVGKLPAVKVDDMIKMQQITLLTPATGISAKVTAEVDKESLPADGKSTAIVTVKVFDAKGNPAAGQAVSMTASSGKITSPADDNKDGTYTAVYTAPNEAGAATIKAETLNGVFEEITINIR